MVLHCCKTNACDACDACDSNGRGKNTMSLKFRTYFTLCAKLIFVASFVMFLQVVSAQSDTNDGNATEGNKTGECPLDNDNKSDSKDFENLIGYVSSDAPLKSVLFTNANESLRESYEWLLNFSLYIERITVKAAEDEDEMDELTKIETHDDRLPVCNTNNKDDWKGDIAVHFEIRCWTSADDNCVTDVIGTNEDIFPELSDDDYDPPSQEDAYKRVVQHSKYVDSLAYETAKRAFQDWDDNTTWGNTTWDEAHRGTGYAFDNTNQECTLDFVGFVKRDGVWYIAERITNKKRRTVAQTLQRQYIHEYIHPADDVPSAKMTLMNNATCERVPGATTAIYLTDGFERPSAFSGIATSENAAVERAITRGDHRAQQADDATTPSNIAILAFPLVMNLVPVALIADVNTIGMLLYTLLTDVLTAVPLVIKGVEVLQIGLHPSYATVSRITGATLGVGKNENNKSDDKVLEVWVAECHAEQSLRSTGIILLVVALTAMVGGIIAEFVAKRWTLRKGAGKVIEDPWTGADVPLVDAIGSDPEPISSTTTVAPSHGGTSAALLLASNAALREREAAAAAAAAASSGSAAENGRQHGDGGGNGGSGSVGNNPVNTGDDIVRTSTSATVVPTANLHQRPSETGDQISAAYSKPSRPHDTRATRGETEQNREKQA